MAGSERGEGGREEDERERKKKRKKEREKESAGELFVLGDVSTYSTTTSLKNLNFSFFVTQQSKKVVRYFIITHLKYSLYRQFRKRKISQKNAPTISSIATRCHKDSV